MRLGIFGGSFDPVHIAHLAIARECQRQASLDEVWFMPVAVQPLKPGGPKASNEQRIEMLRLGINTHPSWRVCTIETDRGGYSYSVDTLRDIKEQLPEASLFFLLGGDTLRDVAHWKEPAELFRLSTPLVVHRASEKALDLTTLSALCALGNQPTQIELPPIDVSSRDIRSRVAAGESIDDLVPPAVAAYIYVHVLYR